MTDRPHSGNLKLGLPIAPHTEWRQRGALVALHARTILVPVGPVSSTHISRLFLRTFEESTYREITFPEALESIRYLTVSDGSDTAYVLVSWSANPNNPRLAKISLPDGLVAGAPTPKITDNDRRVWVSRIYSLSADGSELCVAAGHESPPTVDGRIHIDYKVAIMNTTTGTLEPITTLLTPFV